MNQAIFQILSLIIKSEALQNAAAQPMARLLANALPDVIEDEIASFLRKIADKLEKVNP